MVGAFGVFGIGLCSEGGRGRLAPILVPCRSDAACCLSALWNSIPALLFNSEVLSASIATRAKESQQNDTDTFQQSAAVY